MKGTRVAVRRKSDMRRGVEENMEGQEDVTIQSV